MTDWKRWRRKCTPRIRKVFPFIKSALSPLKSRLEALFCVEKGGVLSYI